MPTAYVNIGSNIGDRHALIGQAVAAIDARFGRRVPVAVSDPVESDPWGYESANRFVNIGVAFDCGDMSPEEVLDALLDIEHSIDPAPHRDPYGTYIDRRIDIDLIAIDDLIVDTPRLTLPHPRMHLRPFVLQPMLRLAPSWRHPITHLTPAELLSPLQTTNRL